jgi:serine/threonine protein kinase
MANTQAVAEHTQASAGRIVPFGKYLLLQRVSVGGMAEVFKALPQNATRIDQIIAIKRILPNIAEDNEFIGMFIDEARVAGLLTHPNVCRIYELGRVGDDHYIAMQFLWGRDLLKVMNRFKKAGQPIPPPMAAYIAAKACAALHYAHFKCDPQGEPLGIIHRDVSPQNIIVGYAGNVKLIDFGVARAATQSQKTQAGILKGKFGYMSPEMIRGLPIDHRSDVFAMGICLHEALTASRLFYGETDFATLELVRDARVVPPSAKEPGVPPALDQIVLTALARDVEHRYATAQDLQFALEHFLATHYPGYGEADVGAMMRQAFSHEVSREKQRLEVFGDMLARGELVRGAPIPHIAGDTIPPSGERSAQGHESPRPTRPSHVEALDIPIEVGPPESAVEDERTQIFFSADELNEIRELSNDPAPHDGPVRQPAPSDLILHGAQWPFADAAHLSTPPPRTPTTSGTYDRAQPGGRRVPATSRRRDQSRVATLAMEAFDPAAHGLVSEPKRSGFMRYATLFVVAALLVVGGYAAARVVVPRTGTIEIAAVGDPDAVVRVDGVVRGNPPLMVEDLSPGSHQLEIEAKGYELAQQNVQVVGGSVTPVSVVLERAVPRPEVGHWAPVVEPGKTSSEPAPATADVHHVKRRVPPKAVASSTSEAPSAPSTPDVAAPGEPAPAESTAPSDGTGELLISTLPWSHVFVDSTDTGRDTPVRALRVAEGQHRIGLRTPDGVTHFVDVLVEAGQTVRIIRRF